MISKKKFVLGFLDGTTEELLAEDLIGWAFDDLDAAKRAANFGALVAPVYPVYEVEITISKVEK